MLKSLLASALGAGLAAGILAAVLQLALIVPLIGEAELYETGALTHFGGGHDDHADGAGHEHGHGHGEAAHDHDHAHDHYHASGLMRTILTIVSTAATYTGFALFVVAGFALAERAGLARIDARSGLLWGLAGFAATQLAPALGLAPELPGSGAAALEARQLWWMIAAVSTAGGIAVLAGVAGPLRLAGLALIALPHLIGAPHGDGYAGVAPPELAAHFAARVLAVGAVAWVVLGLVAGHLWSRESAS